MKNQTQCRPTALRPMRLAILIAAIVALSTAVHTTLFADAPPTQYVNIAPLPGAGMALSPQGKIDGAGALQVNIPVAFTPGNEFYNVSVFGGNHIGEFETTFPSGSATFGVGFGTWPRFYVSAFQVSSLLFVESKAVNAQLQILEETDARPAFAIGTQDLLDKEGAIGPAQSFYGVATKGLSVFQKEIYLTAGYGSGRFLDTFFGGVSIPLSDHFSAAVEWDGFQMNEALAWRPGGRYGNFTITGGYNNKAGLLLGGNLAGKMPTWTQFAIGTALLFM